MPDAKDNAKASGDIHPPEVAEEAQQRPLGRPDTQGTRGSDTDAGAARGMEDEARPGKGENQAGFLKDKEGQPGRNT